MHPFFTAAGTQARLAPRTAFKFSEDGCFTDFTILDSAFDGLFSLILIAGTNCVTTDATTVQLIASCSTPALSFELAVRGKNV